MIGLSAFLLVVQITGLHAQTQTPAPAPSAEETGPGADQLQKASEWVSSLQLNDAARESRVKNLIATQLYEVREWHNAHSYTEVPAGINPYTGQRLSEMDRLIIVDSSIPDSVHQHLMKGLYSNLDSTQVDQILDHYTVGKVAFTLKGYQAIVPDLSTTEQGVIEANLKQARSQAIDFKNMKEISAIFEIYKTKCEGYLNSHGRNWRNLYKAYVNKIKAQKAAKGK